MYVCLYLEMFSGDTVMNILYLTFQLHITGNYIKLENKYLTFNVITVLSLLFNW